MSENNKLHPSWFVGVIEDINDPLEMGRAKVRVFGYHTENKAKIPTASLPWASVVMPYNSASIGGIGESATGILQGSWVFGMFIDGESAQQPLIIGSLPSRSATKSGDSLVGFFDPDGVYPIVENDIDTPLDATTRFEESEEYQKRKSKREDLGQGVTKASSGSWSTPLPQDNQSTVYPHSKVSKSPSGHVHEVDDTPTKERLLEQHKSGTHEEILPDGSKVTYVEGTDYLVVKGKCQIYIHGDCDMHVNGATSIQSKDNINIESTDGEIIMNAKAIRLN